MKVVAYSDSPGLGGAELMFTEVIRGLRGLPLELEIAAPADNPAMSEALSRLSVPYHAIDAQRVRGAAFGPWQPRRGLQIRRTLSHAEPDLLLVNMPGVELGMTPIIWARRPSHGAVALLHLHQSPDQLGRPLGRLRGAIVRPLLRRFSHIMVVSPSGPEEVASTWGIPLERCSVLPLPRPTPQPIGRGEARARLRLAENSRLVGMVGRLWTRQKGLDVFMRAASILVRRLPDVEFVVFGEGPDREELEAAAAAEFGGRMRFLGWVDPPELAYACMDAIAIPSRFEGLPAVAVEAIYSALPGVAADIAGLRDIWPAQWLVEPDDAGALAERLGEILEIDPAERKRVLGRAREVADRLTRTSLEAPLRAVIERVTGTPSPLREQALGAGARATPPSEHPPEQGLR